jgi:hypothetical protein
VFWTIVGGVGILRVDFLDQLFDTGLVLDRLVEEELQFGHAAQPQPLPELTAQERGGPPQCAFGRAARGGVAERRVVQPGELQVGRASCRSAVTRTRVSVRNPMPGSWTSRASTALASARICSARRSVRGAVMPGTPPRGG